MFRTTRGLNRPAHVLHGIHMYMNTTQLPEYPIPSELETVLDINDESTLSRKSEMYSKILESLTTVKYVDLAENHYTQLLKFALYLEEYQSNEEMKKRKMFNQPVKLVFSRYPNEHLFAFHVKELDEERAWIRENDFVDVTDIKTYETYTLRVTKVEQNDVVANDDAAKFCKIFHAKNLYNISFRFQNYPLRCAHYALWRTFKENVITYLFPHESKSFIKTGHETYGELEILNSSIETNPEQKQAVINILNKSSFPAPYILYGPPGTGKTATLVETICQIKKASPTNRILVCTPSNTAADEVAKRLLKFLDACDIYRIYSQATVRSTVAKELRSCCWCGDGSKVPLRREDITGKAVLISTLCTATRFVLMELSASYFSHIIIDEAGQGTEPDMLIPISIASKDGQLYSQIVLVGDPQQLGPTVISKLADIILGRSILERLMSYDIYKKDFFSNYNPRYITKLLHNYRSHPSIIHISNKLFYDDELVAKYSNDEQKVKFPVIFHGVEGVEKKISYSPSTYNYEEIGIVLRYVYDLLDNKMEFGEVTAKDIGIVTPFKLQSKRIKNILKRKDDDERKMLEEQQMKDVKLLKKGENPKPKNKAVKGNKIMKDESESESSTDTHSEGDKIVLENEKDHPSLNVKNDKTVAQKKNGKEAKESDGEEDETKRKRFKDINVGTVELFQGQERKIMIMTAVRSKTFFSNGKEHIGFLSNSKRFNVAMSRAQDALIVIGNPGILQKNGMWRYLLKYCIQNGSYHGLKFALRASNNTQPITMGLQSIANTETLFREGPFKLFSLDGLDSTVDISRTIDVFVEPDKAELEQRAQQQLRETLMRLGLRDDAYF